MPSTGSHAPGKSVLPSFLLWPILAAAVWVSIAVYLWPSATAFEKLAIGPLPGAVVFALALTDYVLWRLRGRPWHDWLVILLLLPPIFAGVWIAIGALVLDASFSRNELLGIAVGPGVALVGLLTTTISYHGRHHPDEYR